MVGILVSFCDGLFSAECREYDIEKSLRMYGIPCGNKPSMRFVGGFLNRGSWLFKAKRVIGTIVWPSAGAILSDSFRFVWFDSIDSFGIYFNCHHLLISTPLW